MTDLVLTTGGADAALDQRFSDELDAHNAPASGAGPAEELSVRVTDVEGELAGGLSGWTWGTCAGIEMLWVRADVRSGGWGSRLVEAAEERGCRQLLVSSFTFQAPEFYRRQGYVELFRSEGLPTEGQADVHFVKVL